MVGPGTSLILLRPFKSDHVCAVNLDLHECVLLGWREVFVDERKLLPTIEVVVTVLIDRRWWSVNPHQ